MAVRRVFDWSGRKRRIVFSLLIFKLILAIFFIINNINSASADPDTTPPIITLNPPNPQIIEVFDSYSELGATADDDIDGDISTSIVIDSSGVDTSVLGNYQVSYNVSDLSGNPASQVLRDIQVVDTTAPIIILIGDNPQVIEVGEVYSEQGASISDNYDTDLSGSLVIDSSSVNTSVLGSYIVAYDVIDTSGNNAVQVTRTVNIVDTTAPVITLTGDDPQDIEVYSAYTEQGATADDNYYGDISGSIIIDSSAVDINKVGVYQVTYDVTDDSSNAAAQAIRDVNVVDTAIPAITLTGDDPQVIEVGSVYTEFGATANDNYDGDISGSIIIDSSEVDTNTLGGYQVAYNVSDTAGNPAAEVIRTVNVVDTTAPTITLVGNDPLGLEVGIVYTDPGATADDNYYGDISEDIIFDSSGVDTNSVGNYQATYNVTDGSGNAATQITRSVNIVDTTEPIITLNGPNPQTIDANDPYQEFGATAVDNYEGMMGPVSDIDNSEVNTSQVGTYQVYYNITDTSGNTASITRTVIVADDENPVIILYPFFDPTVRLEVFNSYIEPGYYAHDSYDGDLAVDIDDSELDITILGTYYIYYSAADSSNNTATTTRTVIVQDTTPPVITLIGDNPQAIELYSPYIEHYAASSDNYDEDIKITGNSSAVNTSNIGSYPATYNISDSSGNDAVEVIRTVNVVDTTSADITNISISNITSSRATISWDTSESADSMIEYGTNQSNLNLASSSDELITNHTINLTNLSASTTYYYLINSKDEYNNLATSSIYNFTTLESDPPVLTNGAPDGVLDYGSTSTIISLNTSELAYCRYATTSGVEYLNMPFVFNETGSTTHSSLITDLANGEEYNYYVRCADELGNANSLDFTISFSVISGFPDLTAIKAGSIGKTSANIYWKTDIESTSQVEYGTNQALGKSTAQNANKVLSHAVALTGLNSNTLYYYRVKSFSQYGKESVSGIYSFKTSSVSTGGGGGGSSYTPVDTTSPDKPTNFKAVATSSKIYFSWVNPDDSDFFSVVIVRTDKSVSYSISVPDLKATGTVIYQGSKEEYFDGLSDIDKNYYFSISAYDSNFNYSSIATVKYTGGTSKEGNTDSQEYDDLDEYLKQFLTGGSETTVKGYESGYLGEYGHLADVDSEIVEQVSYSEAGEVYYTDSFIGLNEEEKEVYNKITAENKDIRIKARQALTYFIKYGTKTTLRLGAGERAGVFNSYHSAFKKSPETREDWQDIIKIANGRWPTERSEEAENSAKDIFMRIYWRAPDMEQPNDNAAVTVIAYGLRPVHRNMDSEADAIETFEDVYYRGPISALDWDTVRAIAYSGAVR